MEPTFVQRVTAPLWLGEVEGWVVDSLAAHGIRVIGPPEQVRVRPWSTQLTVPTDRGTVWVKAACPGLAHEAALHATLAGLVPGHVAAPLAVEEAHGWLLTSDRGATLAESRAPTQADWCALLVAAADLQQRLVGHASEVLATGVPDVSPGTVPDRLAELLETYAALPVEHPAHLGAETRSRLATCRPAIVDAAQTLDGCPLPVTLDHGDLHPGNAFAAEDGLALFDFGDAQWGSAAEVLGTPWGWVTRHSETPWEAVLEAYLACWPELGDRATADTVLAAAMTTLPVNRSLTWWLATRDATLEELGEWGAAPREELEQLLGPRPAPRLSSG